MTHQVTSGNCCSRLSLTITPLCKTSVQPEVVTRIKNLSQYHYKLTQQCTAAAAPVRYQVIQ